jgi:hypothetical protein
LFGKGRARNREAIAPSDIADDGLGSQATSSTFHRGISWDYRASPRNGRFTIAWMDGGPDRSRRGG